MQVVPCARFESHDSIVAIKFIDRPSALAAQRWPLHSMLRNSQMPYNDQTFHQNSGFVPVKLLQTMPAMSNSRGLKWALTFHVFPLCLLQRATLRTQICSQASLDLQGDSD